jgi:hypothetical protein
LEFSQSLDPADGGGEIAPQSHWVSVILFYLLLVCFVLCANSPEQKWSALSTLASRVCAKVTGDCRRRRRLAYFMFYFYLPGRRREIIVTAPLSNESGRPVPNDAFG